MVLHRPFEPAAFTGQVDLFGKSRHMATPANSQVKLIIRAGLLLLFSAPLGLGPTETLVIVEWLGSSALGNANEEFLPTGDDPLHIRIWRQ
jgi:hypothetical protein